MLNIAHRGFKSQYPENTMLAFKKAIEAGCDGIEFDVQLSKDAEVVILHDESLDRTTDLTGRVVDKDLKDLKCANAAKLYPQFEREPVPTLREYLHLVADTPIITNIELKNMVYWYENMEQKVYDLICEFGLKDQIIISSFNHRSLIKMKEIDPKIKCAALTKCWMFEPWKYLKRYKIDYYHPIAYGVDKNLVDNLHKRDIGINVWYMEEHYGFRDVVELGVDGIISDYPDIVGNILLEER